MHLYLLAAAFASLQLRIKLSFSAPLMRSCAGAENTAENIFLYLERRSSYCIKASIDRSAFASS